MDKKAEFIFKHYKECLEKRTFDEYDIFTDPRIDRLPKVEE